MSTTCTHTHTHNTHLLTLTLTLNRVFNCAYESTHERVKIVNIHDTDKTHRFVREHTRGGLFSFKRKKEPVIFKQSNLPHND